MSGTKGVVAKRILCIEPNNVFFQANNLSAQEITPTVEAKDNFNLSAMSVNSNQRVQLSPQQQQQEAATVGGLENILDRTMASLEQLNIRINRLETAMDFRQQQRPGPSNQLNMSMQNINDPTVSNIIPNMGATQGTTDFNLANFRPQAAKTFLQQKVMLSNNMQPARKLEVLQLASLSDNLGDLSAENQSILSRQLAITAGTLLAGASYGLHMSNCIDAASLGIPAPPPPQVRYASKSRHYRHSNQQRGRGRPSRGGRRPPTSN